MGLRCRRLLRLSTPLACKRGRVAKPPPAANVCVAALCIPAAGAPTTAALHQILKRTLVYASTPAAGCPCASGATEPQSTPPRWDGRSRKGVCLPHFPTNTQLCCANGVGTTGLQTLQMHTFQHTRTLVLPRARTATPRAYSTRHRPRGCLPYPTPECPLCTYA